MFHFPFHFNFKLINLKFNSHSQDGYSYLQKLITPLNEKGQRKTLKDLLDDFSTPVKRKAGRIRTHIFLFYYLSSSILISILQSSFLLSPAPTYTSTVILLRELGKIIIYRKKGALAESAKEYKF